MTLINAIRRTLSPILYPPRIVSPETDVTEDEIEAWVEGLERNLFRNKVVLAPNNDFWNDGYWVRILNAEPIELLTAAEKPI